MNRKENNSLEEKIMIIEEKTERWLSPQEQRIEKLQEERNLKYKELDKKIETAGDSLNDDISLLKHQPILGTYIFTPETESDIKTILRVIEKTNQKDNPKNIQIFETLNKEFDLYAIIVGNEEFINLQKEFSEMLETTKGFCYIPTPKEEESQLTVWDRFRDVNLKNISNWDLPDTLFRRIDNLKNDYKLSDFETSNLFVNALLSKKIKTFLNTSEINSFWNKVNDKYILKNENIETFDNILSAKILNRYNYSHIEHTLNQGGIDKINNVSIINTLQNMWEHGLKKSAVALSQELVLGNVVQKQLIYEDEVLNLLDGSATKQDRAIFNGQLDILFQHIAKKDEEKKQMKNIQKELGKEKIFGDKNCQKVWNNIRKVVDEGEGRYDQINKNNLFNNQPVDYRIYNRLVDYGFHEMNIAMAIVIPRTMIDYHKIYGDNSEFADMYFENGGDLDLFSKYFRS